jgi:hypothetical protein
MSPSRELASRFQAYGDWRRRLSAQVSALHRWLGEQDLADAQVDLKVQRTLERLQQDRMVVAFVAEFSRGKSELINAIFFADFGQRLLPSSAGRTTMCPTELLWDPSRPPSIRLLPIETRGKDASVAEYKAYADEWITIPLDLGDAEGMADALSRVSQVKQVPATLARRYALAEEADLLATPEAPRDGPVDIPCWRHAEINFPHPLLKQGLVILDTPGLNAIGTEPELTLNLLPNAHALLFVLAADAGATRTDLEVWNRHLTSEDPTQRTGRIVVLNKIDGLWDELRSDAEVDAEIERQVASSAALLGVPPAQVFPVSAQKALLAKVNGDDALLDRSRLPALEDALSARLIPAKREMVGAAAQADVRAIAGGVRALLEGRRNDVAEQLAELNALRGKNHDVIEHMMERVREEKEGFERGLQRFSALRSVFTQETNALLDLIGLDSLRTNAARTRRSIEDSTFTTGMRAAMNDFFATIRRDFEAAARKTSDVHDMMHAMYLRFASEPGRQRFLPPPLSMLKYQKEFDRLERAYNQHFNTLWNMLSRAKFALLKRFFETIALRARHVYQVANRDVESWLKATISPLETQVKEHHQQLRRRLDSVRRIHGASNELDERIGELEQQDEALRAQLAALEGEVAAIDRVIAQPDALPLAANA